VSIEEWDNPLDELTHANIRKELKEAFNHELTVDESFVLSVTLMRARKIIRRLIENEQTEEKKETENS